jgi:hypothetical protein
LRCSVVGTRGNTATVAPYQPAETSENTAWSVGQLSGARQAWRAETSSYVPSFSGARPDVSTASQPPFAAARCGRLHADPASLRSAPAVDRGCSKPPILHLPPLQALSGPFWQAHNAETRGAEDPCDAGEAGYQCRSICRRCGWEGCWRHIDLLSACRPAGHRFFGGRQDHVAEPHSAAEGRETGGGD